MNGWKDSVSLKFTTIHLKASIDRQANTQINRNALDKMIAKSTS